MDLGKLIGAGIAIQVLFAVVGLIVLGGKKTVVTTARKSWRPSKKGDTLKPKELLDFLRKGDRTMDDIRNFVGDPNATVGDIIDRIKRAKTHE